MSEKINLPAVCFLKSRDKISCYQHLEEVLKTHKNGCFIIKCIDTDQEFEYLLDTFEGVAFDAVELEEYANKVKRSI